MTDRHDRFDPDDRADGRLDAVLPLLADPDLWVDPDPALEEAVVEEVARRATLAAADDAAATPVWRRWGMAALAAAAAVLLTVVVVTSRSDDTGDRSGAVELALSGTELAADATATALVADTPPGTRIDLTVGGLGPAPAGAYYEAWMWDDDGTGVSAGTFHLRGGAGTIELWSGVSLDEYPHLSITLQDEGQAEPSGVVLLTTAAGP